MFLLLALQYVGTLLAQLLSTLANFILKTCGIFVTTLFEAAMASTIQTIFHSVFSIFVVPLSTVYSYLLYTNLRNTRPELANQPVKEKYKWLYVFSPTTVLIFVLLILGFLVNFVRGM